MATFSELLLQDVIALIDLAWAETTMKAFVPQLQRYNYQNEMERLAFVPPFAVIQFGEFQPATDYSGVNMAFRVTVNIFYVINFTPSTTSTETARLLERLIELGVEAMRQPIGYGVEDGSLSIDATENNPIASLFLQRDFPLTGGQVSFTVLTGFGIG